MNAHTEKELPRFLNDSIKSNTTITNERWLHLEELREFLRKNQERQRQNSMKNSAKFDTTFIDETWLDMEKAKEIFRKDEELQRQNMEMAEFMENIRKFEMEMNLKEQNLMKNHNISILLDNANRKRGTEMIPSLGRSSHEYRITYEVAPVLVFFFIMCGLVLWAGMKTVCTSDATPSDPPGSRAPGTECRRSHPRASDSTSGATVIHITTNENNEGHQSGEATTVFHLPMYEYNRPSVSLINTVPYASSDRNESETLNPSIEYRQFGGSMSRISDTNLVTFDIPPSYHPVSSRDLFKKCTTYKNVF